jgi:Mg-chelatase subunit ChlD
MTSTVYAAPLQHKQAPTTCTPAKPISEQSLLVVLLDRSGSLTAQPGATDPAGYSTSVTKALTDLWPGKLAVIPFSNDRTSLLGPIQLSNPADQAALQTQIQNAPIGGDTPLGPAMHKALDVLNTNGTPPGSRLVIITDGQPDMVGDVDGSHQSQDIRQNLLHQFCQQGVPVNVFGLTIDTSSPAGQQANRLLSDIATGTDASYTNVKNAQDLAREVINLYAQWQHLTFTAIPRQGNNYTTTIDSFANQVSFIAFRSEPSQAIALIGPDQKQITQGFQQSTDNHYEIFKFDNSGPLVHGNYTLNMSGNTPGQVYALIKSPLQVTLVQPTTQSTLYTGRPVEIEAQFTNGNGAVTPGANTAEMLAQVTPLVNGQPAGSSNTIVLTQQQTAAGVQPLFSGSTQAYQQPGQLQIELTGTFQNAQRQTSLTLPVKPTTPQPATIPRWLLIGGLIALLLLIGALCFAFLRARRARPFGYVTNGKRNGEVDLTQHFSQPVIHSQELEKYGSFQFLSNFDLVFSKDGAVKIRARQNGVAIDKRNTTKLEQVTENGLEITPGSKIYINNRPVASFESRQGRVWH